MKKYQMTIDLEKCINCNNCFLSCKDEHYDNDWPPYALAQPRHGHRWMNILRKEQGTFPHINVAYLPKPCLHCADAPCIQKASNNEIYRRPDGIVIIDPEKAKGRKDLVSACPHGAIFWNEDNQTPQKCTLCAHLLDQGWEAPRCVQACPTGALSFQKMTEEEREAHIRSDGLETIDGKTPGPAAGTPVVLYKHLQRFNTCFIAGSVAAGKGAVEECVEGVTVDLLKNGVKIAGMETNAFGDYRFSGLPKNGGTYELAMTWGGKALGRTRVDLKESCYAGTLWV